MKMFRIWVSLPFYILLFYVTSTFGSSWSNGCNRPLGLQDRRVHDSQLSSPSFYEYLYIGNGKTVHTKPEYARLNNARAWCASGGKNYYIQLHFDQSAIVTGIATQGFSGINDYYVKEYRVIYSQDGVTWNSTKKVWRGNSDAKTVVNNTFNAPVSARYIRVYPVSYKYHICMRMELYGCTNYSVKATTPAPYHTPSTANFEASTHTSSRATVAATTQDLSSTTAKATTHTSSRATVAATTQDLSSTTAKATTHTSSRATVAATTKGLYSIPVKATTEASRSVNETNFSVPWYVPSGEREDVAETGALLGKNVSPMTHKTLVIWLTVAAAFLLIALVPVVMFLILLRHRKHKRCSKYQFGSDVMYGIPLTAAVVNMDLCNQGIDEYSTPAGKYNSDGITLLPPHAV